MKRIQAGFTLIELTIVVAIVGILAAIALPAYVEHLTQAKIAEIMSAMGPCRSTVTEGYLLLPASPGAGAWGCEVGGGASKYVDSVTVDANGVITVTASSADDLPPSARGARVQWLPTDSTGAVLTFTPSTVVTNFYCQSFNMSLKYLPSTCQNSLRMVRPPS